jgi:trimethylamine:corrinoid methyltransferase-like protein
MPESKAEAQALLEMGAGIRGSAQALAERPLFSALVCTVSPLAHHGPVVEAGSGWLWGLVRLTQQGR